MMSIQVRARELDSEAREANSHVTGMETRWAREYKDIKKILNHQYSARSHVLKFLSSMGLTIDSPPEVVPQSLQTKGRVKRKSTLQAMKQAPPPAPPGENLGPSIPSTYSNLGAMSAKLLSERVLPTLDKVSLSCANAKAFTRGMSSDQAREELKRVLEFVTGQVPDSVRLVDKLRFWNPLLDLVQSEASARYRSPQFEFGSDWALNGVYMITIEKGHVVVSQRYTSETVALDPDSLRLNYQSLEEITIDKNWSETQAELRTVHLPLDKAGHRIGHYFRTHVQCKPKAKKRTPALQDVGEAALITPVKVQKKLQEKPRSSSEREEDEAESSDEATEIAEEAE
eukprot:1608152-Amphidinium_carterae.1